MSIRTFLKEPFNPRNNIYLFNRYVEPLLPKPESRRLMLEDCQAIRDTVRRLYPELDVPSDDDLLEATLRYGTRSVFLVATHDLMHGELSCQQTPAGEYALGAKMLVGQCRVTNESSYAQRLTEIVYGMTTLATLPVGCLRAGDFTAPIRGAMCGLLGVYLWEDV